MTHSTYIRCRNFPKTGVHGLSEDELFKAAMNGQITAYISCSIIKKNCTFWLCEKLKGKQGVVIVGHLFFSGRDLLPLYPQLATKIYFSKGYHIRTFPYESNDGRDLFITAKKPNDLGIGMRITTSDIIFLAEEVKCLSAKINGLPLSSDSNEPPYLPPTIMDEGATAIWKTIEMMWREEKSKPFPKAIWNRLVKEVQSGTFDMLGLKYVASEDRIETGNTGQRESLTYSSTRKRIQTWHKNYLIAVSKAK